MAHYVILAALSSPREAAVALGRSGGGFQRRHAACRGDGLAQHGHPSERVYHFRPRAEKDTLACAKECLRHGALGAVVVETSELELTAARRCELYAERLVAVRRYWPTSQLGTVEQRRRTPAR